MSVLAAWVVGIGFGLISGAFLWYRAGYVDGWHDGREDAGVEAR